MKKNLLQLFIFTLTFCGFNITSSAQLFVDTTYSALQMAYDFFDGSCVTVTDAEFTGAPNAMGYFDASATNLGMNAGILLTSGSVENAIGPNNVSGETSGNDFPGDVDLDAIPGVLHTHDAAVFEMDIVPEDTLIRFEYVFGSEEYLEFVGSFNDVFAFFVSGPGITGMQNIALVPGSNVEVSINNVNDNTNPTYYVDNGDGFTAPQNADSTYIQYDGFTIVLTASMEVIPYEVYHIKLAIADDLDFGLDSGVFISVESLCGSPDVPLSSDFDTETIAQDELTVTFNNLAKYATSWNWDFGDGNTSSERYPVHTYANPGIYSVVLYTTNYCCESTTTLEVAVGDVTSIGDLSGNDFGIELSPNPSHDRVTIALPKSFGETQLQLFDVAGNLLLDTSINQNESLDLSDFGKGVYFLRFTNDGKKVSKKLMIH